MNDNPPPPLPPLPPPPPPLPPTQQTPEQEGKSAQQQSLKRTAKPQERERYTFEFKANVLDLLEENKLSKNEIIEKFKLKKRTLNQWLQKKDEIRKVYKSKRGLKTSSHQHLGKVERGIKHFFELSQMKKGKSRIPITGRTLGAKAVLIKDAILERHKNGLIPLDEKELNAMQAFTGSDAWGRKIALRFGLKNIGEPVEVDDESISQRMEELRDIIAGYDPKNVFNMDETCFFFKQLPSNVYVQKLNNSQQHRVQGTKLMTYTDRVTMYVCTNEDGSYKFPLTMIGASKEPPCFKNRPQQLPMKYFSQKRAWSDTKTLKEWWDYFLTSIRDYTSAKVLLIMCNCGPHAFELVDPLDQVRVKVLPLTYVNKHQPIHADIIAIIKRNARKAYLLKVLEAYELRHELRAQAQRLKMQPSIQGIDQGEAPHLHDAMVFIQSAWNNLTREMIRNCWNDCKLRRDTVTTRAAETAAPTTRTKTLQEDEEVDKVPGTDKKDMLDLILQAVKAYQLSKTQKIQAMEEEMSVARVLFEESLQGMAQAMEASLINDSLNRLMNSWYRMEEADLVMELLDQDINDEIDAVLTGSDNEAKLEKTEADGEANVNHRASPTERTLSSKQLDWFFSAAEPTIAAMQDDAALHGLAVEARDLLFKMKRQLCLHSSMGN